jgi:hypothetical protein
MAQFQNMQLLIDWSFGWMVVCWGAGLLMERLYVKLRKMQIVAVVTNLWAWMRNAYWLLWVWQSPGNVYAIVMTWSLLIWVGSILLFLDADLWYAVIAFSIASLLSFVDQHIYDESPYTQCKDDQNPWRGFVWVTISLLAFAFLLILTKDIYLLCKYGYGRLTQYKKVIDVDELEYDVTLQDNEDAKEMQVRKRNKSSKMNKGHVYHENHPYNTTPIF